GGPAGDRPPAAARGDRERGALPRQRRVVGDHGGGDRGRRRAHVRARDHRAAAVRRLAATPRRYRGTWAKLVSGVFRMAIAPRIATAATPAKATLRALLSQHATRLGLTASAIDTIVARSQITHWRPGQPRAPAHGVQLAGAVAAALREVPAAHHAAEGPAGARARDPGPRLRAAASGGRARRSAPHAGGPRRAGGRLARQGEPLRGGSPPGRQARDDGSPARPGAPLRAPAEPARCALRPPARA